MADYQILFQKADTIASGSSLVPGGTQFQLTSGNFGTHADYYVIDYDVSSLAEVVELAINGTTATVISRGRDGTAQQTHGQGAKIGSMWTTSHQVQLVASLANFKSALPTVQKTTLNSGNVVINSSAIFPVSDFSQSVVCTVPTVLHVNLILDITIGGFTGNTNVVAASLTVDGSIQTSQVVFDGGAQTGTETRGTVSQQWIVPLIVGTHALSVNANKAFGNSAICYINTGHSTMVITTYPNPF